MPEEAVTRGKFYEVHRGHRLAESKLHNTEGLCGQGFLLCLYVMVYFIKAAIHQNISVPIGIASCKG